MQRMGLMKLWMLSVMAVAAALTMSGCSGSNGATGPAGKDANGTVSAATMTADELKGLKLSSTNSFVTGVTINSPPVITFTVRDVNNRGVTGLGYTTKNTVGTSNRPATNLVGLSNIAFTIAKLVPGSNGSPNKWVNYIVWSLPYTKTDGTVVAAAPSKPTTDNNGTLVDNGDGSYTYTFARDIKLAQSILDTATYSGNNVKADLGDVTYEPSLPHRLVVQIGGTVRGTGSNNTDGTNTATNLTAVTMTNPLNLIYDFIPSTGAVIKVADAQREIVDIAKCNECHGKGLAAIHGSRVEAKYCVTCHTDQRKYGNAEATTTTTGFSGSTYKINNQAQGEFVTMVHKIHMSSKLAKDGYDYAGMKFDKGGYPQDPGLCSKCHSQSSNAAQGNNWKTKPSRLACGTCHDGINWADGTGSTVADAASYKSQRMAFGVSPLPIAKSNHAGGVQPDSACVMCHSETLIESNHRQLNKTANNPTLPAGLKHITYELKSATVVNDSTTIVFRINVDGTPLTLPTTAFTGGPSFLLAYSLPQEGSTTASPDYNNLGRSAAQPISVSLASIISGANGTLSSPDASGYYTANIPAGANSFPANSKYRTVALQGTYTQVANPPVLTTATARPAISVQVAVTGDSVRRKVVDPNKCGSCHEWFQGHGGSRVFETQVCVMCHVPNLSSSGKGIASQYVTPGNASFVTLTPVQTALLTTWTTNSLSTYILGFSAADASTYPEAPQNFKDMIHGIHAGSTTFNSESKRSKGMQFVRDRASSGAIVYFDASAFKFPNKLSNCESCHIPGSYATSKIPSGALQSNNWTTTDSTLPTPAALSSAQVATARGAASLPNSTDRVTSPITASCVSCHDSALAQAHMTTNGGKINGLRNTAYFEQCNLCHGDGSDFDPAKVHNR
jgi:OmcA/MtrC family decaheme c-type cytochrome